jgi:hypothetical protein
MSDVPAADDALSQHARVLAHEYQGVSHSQPFVPGARRIEKKHG